MKPWRSAYALYLISGMVLLVGLSSAFFIYRASESQLADARSEEGEGALYELNPEYSKQYLRALELYGGQANVLAYEIRRWFVGLWHGKSLAYIVAGIAIFVSVGVSYAARCVSSTHPPSLEE
ncbi:MAG: hypothetical protein ACHQ4J_07225 [Candidatus Binatia bacterium]